jgi:glycosyltransferase involved in cell wall biosynthesis
LRILTVSAFYEIHGGGIEIVAGATARALARRGHDCHWAAAGFDSPPSDPLVAPVPLASSDPIERVSGLPMPIPSAAARRLLERAVVAADAVLIHDALYLSSLLAARYARRHQKPWILIQHIGQIAYSNPLLRLAMAVANRLVTRPLLSAAPQVLFISDAVRSFFAGASFNSPPQLLLNGVDQDLFHLPSDSDRNALRSHFGFSSEARELLFVGRFVEKKGLPAIRELARTNPQWNLSLIGSGPIDPGDWNLPNVRLLGRKSREELAELYRAADALVLPSVGEGFPLVVQEAMACGMPVFCGLDSAAADPGAKPLLHGIEVDLTDPVATSVRFAKAIAATTVGPEPQLAAYAHATYDWDANARSIERQLDEMLRDQPAASTFRQPAPEPS